MHSSCPLVCCSNNLGFEDRATLIVVGAPSPRRGVYGMGFGTYPETPELDQVLLSEPDPKSCRAGPKGNKQRTGYISGAQAGLHSEKLHGNEKRQCSL